MPGLEHFRDQCITKLEGQPSCVILLRHTGLGHLDQLCAFNALTNLDHEDEGIIDSLESDLDILRISDCIHVSHGMYQLMLISLA